LLCDDPLQWVVVDGCPLKEMIGVHNYNAADNSYSYNYYYC